LLLHWLLFFFCSISHHVQMHYGYWSRRDCGFRPFF
jgi:hypothetical protein